MENAVLRLRRVTALTGLSRSSIYKFVGDGRFPRPIRLGARSVAWLEREVEAWLAERIAERDDQQSHLRISWPRMP